MGFFFSFTEFSKKRGELKWWLVLIPCLAVLIGFPVLYFLYREQIEEGDIERHHLLENEKNLSSGTS